MDCSMRNEGRSMLKGILALVALALSPPARAQEALPVPDYASPGAWLCLPGRADSCGSPLPTTALNANGYGSTGLVRPAEAPQVDCFYVYPTVSRDPGLNSALEAGPEEIAAASVQFARFSTVCRTFAPLYRQMTLAAIGRVAAGENVLANFALAYGDVLAAWRHYLQHHNQGRPFVLIGHSQGTIHLIQLLAREIEGRPEAERMLSAMLIGYNIEVPEGQLVGGTFRRTPLCSRAGQTGCVISYVSFRSTNPPPSGAMFGRAAGPGMTVACTNPAALGRAGSTTLDSYWYVGGSAAREPSTIRWSNQGSPATPFVRTEGLVSAACVNRGNAGYLSLMVNADPADARTDDIPGDVVIGGQVQPGWGMHLADMSVAQGDLIRLIEEQAAAFRR
jgi:hypothetical protein